MVFDHSVADVFMMLICGYRFVILLLWLQVDRAKLMPIWDAPIFSEELYDHRGESLSDLGTRETSSVAGQPAYQPVRRRMREQLKRFLREEVVYIRDIPLLGMAAGGEDDEFLRYHGKSRKRPNKKAL